MEHFAGIDVSLEASSVCVVDAAGQIVREGKVATTPEALAQFLADSGVAFARIGFEAGPLAPWLFEGLVAAGLPVSCIETRRMKVFTSASPVKTDRKDAQAIAQAMRMGFFRAVHMKTRASLEARLMLTNRSLLLRQRLQVQNTIRGTLKGFGLKLGAASQGRFLAKVRMLIADRPVLQAAIEPLLAAWQALRLTFLQLDRLVRRAAADDPVCRLLMTAPGVGSVVALAFRTGIDDVNRFAKSRLVGVHFGLTPRKYASGRIDRNGRITKCGDAMVRRYLFEAANSILARLRKSCDLRDWALEIAKKTSPKNAKVALARRLAIMLHRMWLTGEAFRWPPAAAV
jgi:transposase